MKRILVPLLAAALLLATDHSGVRPRGAPRDYPASDSAGGITIAAALVPESKVQHQLSRDMVKAGYVVFEIAVYPDPGKDVDLSIDDFTMTAGSDTAIGHTESPAEVVQSLEAGQRTNPPKPPPRVQVQTEETIGVTNGGYDPVTGRRYPAGVYTSTGVGVGVGDPRNGPGYPGDPRFPGPPTSGGAPHTLRAKLEEKALPEGRTTKAVAGYLYFPEVSPRLKNSGEPYHVNYSGLTGEIHLTLLPK